MSYRPTTILLVDDDAAFLRSFTRILKRHPFKVISTQNPDEVMGILKTEPVDIVISDESMPCLRGTELLERIKDEYPRIIRMLVTGSPTLTTTMKAINNAETYRLLLKPCDSSEVLDSLQAAIQMIKRPGKYIDKSDSDLLRTLTVLEENFPGITTVNRDESGAIVLDDEELYSETSAPQKKDEV